MLDHLSLRDMGIVIVSLIVSMTLHEAMHAYVSHALGDTTAQAAGRLTLNPLKHVDLLTTVLLPIVLIGFGLPPIFVARPVPFDPDSVKYGEYGAALVGVAGPLTNFALAVLASLLIRFGAGSFTSVLIVFMQVNLAFFVFNMIPLPPLDGSRLLYAVAPEPVQRVMFQIENAGFMVTLLALLLLSPLILPVVSNITMALLNFLLR